MGKEQHESNSRMIASFLNDFSLIENRKTHMCGGFLTEHFITCCPEIPVAPNSSFCLADKIRIACIKGFGVVCALRTYY